STAQRSSRSSSSFRENLKKMLCLFHGRTRTAAFQTCARPESIRDRNSMHKDRILRQKYCKSPAYRGGSRTGVALCTLMILLVYCAPGLYGQVRERSKDYDAVQKRLATGWNTWDVHSVTTQVLLPEGLAIRVALQHKTTLYGDALLEDVLIGEVRGVTRSRYFPDRTLGTAVTPMCVLRGEIWICGFKARTRAKTW